MGNIETFCLKISDEARANWMIAYVSSVEYKFPVIKLCPENRDNTPLLVLGHKAGLYLLRHKSNELTNQYQGRKISINWVIGFIKANRDEKNKDTCGGGTAWGSSTYYSDSDYSSGFYGRNGDEAGDWRDFKK